MISDRMIWNLEFTFYFIFKGSWNFTWMLSYTLLKILHCHYYQNRLKFKIDIEGGGVTLRDNSWMKTN